MFIDILLDLFCGIIFALNDLLDADKDVICKTKGNDDWVWDEYDNANCHFFYANTVNVPVSLFLEYVN